MLSVKLLSNVLSEKLLPIVCSVTPLSNTLSEKLLPFMCSVVPLSNVLSETFLVQYAHCNTIVQCAQ